MRTNGFLAGWLLAAGLMLSGCQSVIQAGLPDPKLTERDKQMMALADADEWRIPVIRNKIEYRTNEDSGDDHNRHQRRTISTTSCLTAKQFNIGSRAARSIWDGPAARPSER